MDNSRKINLNKKPVLSGPVVYWMSRDQRIHDNWALIHAQEIALELKQPLIIVFFLQERFLEANPRIFLFMIKGLEEVSDEAYKKSIPFVLRFGEPAIELLRFAHEIKPSAIVSDFSPLKLKAKWTKEILKKIDIKYIEVDAHNIVPCWIASEKKEYSARTIRPKITKLLPCYLTDFPTIAKHPFLIDVQLRSLDFKEAKSFLGIKTAKNYNLIPGYKSGMNKALNFIKGGIDGYHNRNRLSNKSSNLSPYLHFGQISAQKVALLAHNSSAQEDDLSDFLEELIIRRELAENFCFYEPHYDSIKGFPSWAAQTLDEHRSDLRPYIYFRDVLESYQTHDKIWNFAQKQMAETGKMNGYLRMYWAKKILEWTPTPEEAIDSAIYFNDKYELDGRDPNGYAGIAWSMGGVHDRPWAQRPVFGKIRYMSENGSVLKSMCRETINK